VVCVLSAVEHAAARCTALSTHTPPPEIHAATTLQNL